MWANQYKANLDEFDPYAETETTEVVETRVDAEGVVHTTVTKTTRVIRSRSNSREVPDTQTDEPPCDDLLGGLANGTMTTTSGMNTADAVSLWAPMKTSQLQGWESSGDV
ncbi:hypothetical protein NP493_192g03124 [Ridgeia piscesae]|uniref:Uncharacterized protein n=1 Tax=Ridgeia piscesae TaxID=27915 RepID=A0AAD9P218_RIDPI|nr:hypothetical protein NP493_192g03124 [Ridgeia piscesae]